MSHDPAQAERSGAQLADIQCRYGHIWRRQGKLDKAIVSFRRALELDPRSSMAHLELGRVLLDQRRLDEAIDVLEEGLAVDPTVSEMQKEMANAQVERGGHAAALHYYGLEREDSKPFELGEHDILCCVVVRNEAERLPYFLSYYRTMGVARFFIVDNGSTDETTPFLLDQLDVHLWRSTASFTRINFGAAPFEVLLREYGRGHWSVIVDADELLVYPGCEEERLPALCAKLDGQGKRVLTAVLLDMYSDGPIGETHYRREQPFIDVCPYFDRQFYHTRYENWNLYRNGPAYFGGVRQRVFGAQGRYNISKIPLIKYDLDCVLVGGQHWTNLPSAEIAVESGCLLHFKFFSSFGDYAEQQVKRQEHYLWGMQYVQYQRVLDNDRALTLYHPEKSVRYGGSKQLERLGIIQRGEGVANTDTPRPTVKFPTIGPVRLGVQRPFWSVMITTYTRVDLLERALRSVLEGDPGPAEMQIEVVNDAAEPEIVDRLEREVQRIAGDRVPFYRNPARAGHPHIFNLCIERARGQWVHILHDDDWVEKGFYSALGAGIEAAPDVGAAFCRQIRVDVHGEREWISWLERETPGILEDWLERIAVFCRLQFASIAVKRDAYGAVGGFTPEVGSAFDWDMWKRLAVRFPVWYEPRALAYFFQGSESETHGLIRTGRQIADARRAIELARSYLPVDRADELTSRARERYASYALEVARGQWRKGDLQAALANVHEGLRCSRTYALESALLVLQSQMTTSGMAGATG